MLSRSDGGRAAGDGELEGCSTPPSGVVNRMVVTPSTPGRRGDAIADLVDDRVDARAQLELQRARSASRCRWRRKNSRPVNDMLERRQVARVEPGIDVGEPQQAVDQETRAGQQHERRGDLEDDEGAAQPQLARAMRSTQRSPALNAVGEIEARRLQRRQHAEDDRRDAARRGAGEQQHRRSRSTPRSSAAALAAAT